MKASTRVETSCYTTSGSQVKENQQSICSASTSCSVSVNSGSKTSKKIKYNNRKQLNRLDRFVDMYERSIKDSTESK